MRSMTEGESAKTILSLEPIQPKQMAEISETVGVEKAAKQSATVFGLAISAGVFIGLAFVFCVTVLTGSGSFPWGISRLLGGVAFSMGLMLLAVCGGELFTSSVLTSVSYASRRISLLQMLRNWGMVYLGNFVGALLLVALMWGAKVHELAGGAWGITLMQLAQHKLHHGFGQAVVLGVLCNLLVCLAVWMTFSTRNPAEKAILVVMPVAMFVSAGFEHVVANMFLVPLAILVHATADSSYWLASGHLTSEYADLTLMRFVTSNLIPVTLGNIVGGLLVGLGYWLIYRRETKPKTTGARATVAVLQRYAHPEIREEAMMQR